MRRFEYGVFKGQGKHENSFLLQVRVRNMQFGIVVPYTQSFAFLHRVDAWNIATATVLDDIQFLWIGGRDRRGFNEYDCVF